MTGHDAIVAAARPDGTGPTAWGADEVCVAYGKTVALDCVTLPVPPGQVTAVVGGDGAGKSTLLRCLAGVLAPDSGTIRRPAKEHSGYLPASSGIYPDLTVAENLAFAMIKRVHCKVLLHLLQCLQVFLLCILGEKRAREQHTAPPAAGAATGLTPAS